jgi:hypothetical protein
MAHTSKLTVGSGIKEEEEEEDTFIYQLWTHEGHEYSHTQLFKT